MNLEELVEAFRKGEEGAHYKGRGYSLTVRLVHSGTESCVIMYRRNGRQTNIFMREGGEYFVWDCTLEGVPLSIDDKMFALQEKIISLLGMHRTILPTMVKCSGDWHILETVRPVNPITIDSLWGEL